MKTHHPTPTQCISQILPIRTNAFLQDYHLKYMLNSGPSKIYELLILLCHLEQAVVGADGEVVGLGDVVHQGPEVLDSVEGRHLQNTPNCQGRKLSKKITNKRDKETDMKQTKVQFMKYEPVAGSPPSFEIHSCKTRASKSCSVGASQWARSSQSVTWEWSTFTLIFNHKL